MLNLQRFGETELEAVERAQEMAEDLISGFYVLAPREWARVHYEIRTLDRLAPEEVCDQALAQVLCYDRVKQVGARIVEQHDLYRICLQDHRILPLARPDREREKFGPLQLEALLLYLLTHELVHVVRFSQRMQCLDLDPRLRHREEAIVEQTTRNILAPVKSIDLRRVLDTLPGYH